MKTLKVLAVADPAVRVYVDESYHILENYPQKDVKIQFDIVDWEKYFDTMMQAFDGKADYDIVMIAGHLWLNDFVNKGYLAPLNYDFEDILPVIAQEMTCMGKTYLSPSFCDGHMLVYRKKALKEALGKLPDEIISVNQVAEMAHKLKASGYEYPIALKAHASEILLDALPYLRTGSAYDVYEQEGEQAVCHISEMAKGLKTYLDLKAFAPKETSNYGNDEIKDALAKNEVVLATTWSGQLGVVNAACEMPEDLGYATFDTAWNVTWSFAVTSASSNKEAAEAFLEYLRSKEVDALAGAYSGAPVRKSNYIEGMQKFPWYGVQLRMIEECAKPFIPVMNAGEKNGLLYETLYKYFTATNTDKEDLVVVQQKINAL